MQVAEMCLEVFQVVALRPMIWVMIEKPQILAIGFDPVCKLSFHGFSVVYDGEDCEWKNVPLR